MTHRHQVEQAAQNKGPVLGVTIRNLTASEQSQLNLKGGILIQEVKRGGIASQSRMAAGDIITQINNKTILNSNDFIKAVSELKKRFNCTGFHYPSRISAQF